MAGSCEDSNEPSDSINGREFVDSVSNYQLIKEDSASWS
jgi:hypothetical protein